MFTVTVVVVLLVATFLSLIVFIASDVINFDSFSLPFRCFEVQARNQDFMWGVLTGPKWTKLPKCIFFIV